MADEEKTASMLDEEKTAASIPDSTEAEKAEAQEPPRTKEFTVRSSLVLTASALGLFCTAGLLNAFGVFVAEYTTLYLRNESAFDISWIGSFSIFLFFLCGAPAGFLADRFGPQLPLVIGSVCQLVALFMISLCKEYYQFFLAQGVLLGIGLGFITIPAASVAPIYFQKNRGLAQGIIIGGSSCGGVIWPILLDQLLNKDHVSFGWTLRIVGFIQLALLIIVCLGIRKPQAVIEKEKLAKQNKDFDAAADKKEKALQRKESMKKLKHPSYIFLCAGLAVFYFGFFAPFFFVTTYGIHLGSSETFSIYLISILNAASWFGRVMPGLLADRVGHFNILLISMLGSCVVGFCWTAVTSIAGLIVWSLAYGFVSGAVLSLQLAAASLVAPKEVIGAAFGMLMGSIALTALFGTPIAGELVKSGYLALSMFAGATMLVGGIFVTLARLSRERKIWAKA